MVKILSRILARQKAKNLKWEVNGVASFFTSIGEYSVITSMIEGPRYCL